MPSTKKPSKQQRRLQKRKEYRREQRILNTPQVWTDRIAWEATNEEASTTSTDDDLRIVSWNVLAETYCKPKSHPQLPHASIVFDKKKRRSLLHKRLRQLAALAHVICLQEVDRTTAKDALEEYATIESPRGSLRADSVGVYVHKEHWKILDDAVVQLDDLACLGQAVDCSHAAAGLQQAFLRRNVAVLVRLQHVVTGRCVVVVNTHLYWNPHYDYIKLCQVHYVLQKATEFANQAEPVVLCGDLNARPNGVTHSYLRKGWINAHRYVAPWRQSAAGVEINVEDDDDDNLKNLTNRLSLQQEKPMRYILDATLNKFCRWLRILGIDTALETEEEEKMRTSSNPKMVLLDRCREEDRVLITTSKRLVGRNDCPSNAYCINPTRMNYLEAVLGHLLLTHGVVLDPSTFLSRCVVCNGMIELVDSKVKAKLIMDVYQAPHDESLNVYQCDCCGQGYWWCDRPTSSASRVKSAATRLFEVCLRAGVPIVQENGLGMFGHVDVSACRGELKEEIQGFEYTQQQLTAIKWLKQERLECPRTMTSVYADLEPDAKTHEQLPFTNVTAHFVDALDYIFVDKGAFSVSHRLYVPQTFKELNPEDIRNGHLLPSKLWPSDHLAIGARIRFSTSSEADEVRLGSSTDEPQVFCAPLGSPPPAAAIPHGARCDCGCVPAIPSLFEMAALRRKAKEQRELENEKVAG